jgi:tRNA-2-methylthio-N6-dimethylallyladenosine synthase
MKEPKTFFIRTYGCQMNELDTEIIAGTLEERGITQIDDENSAELLIYNTCSIRDLAERKVMGKLGLLGTSSRRDALIGVTGCMANAKKEQIFQKIPYVDFVLGTNNIHNLNSVLDEVLSTGKQKILTDEQFTHELNYLSAKREDKLKANVSIIRGCDKFCTYCVVPYTRGPESSRSPANIVEECLKLVEQGYKEITLLGQNVNSYGKDKPEWNCLFHDLLYQLDKIPGMTRIRFMTSHPVDITKELMEAVRDLKSLCEFVHFPIQAGSNRILKKMHRIYTVEEYLEKVQMLKEIVPGVALGTDIIVGFPTETEEEFQATYDIIEKNEYALGYFYTYSPRKGTPAMRWNDDVPDEVKQDRLQRLLKLQSGITAKKQSAMLGEVVEVLVDGHGSGESQLKGRSRNFEKVIFEGGADLIGTLQNVRIHGFSHETLIGARLPALNYSSEFGVGFGV